MKRILLTVIFCLSFKLVHSQSGLKFNSNNFSKDNRTSFNVFNRPVLFENQVSIKFDLSFYNKIFIGNILTLIDTSGENNFSFNYNYNFNSQKGGSLNINHIGQQKIFSVPISEKKINTEDWIKIEIIFDFKNELVRFIVGEKKFSVRRKFLTKSPFYEIVFGKSKFNSDIPAFKIRNLKINGSKSQYSFQLKQSEGNQAVDDKGKWYGKISNPYWIANDHYKWKKIFEIELEENYVVVFDSLDSRIFLVAKDKLFTYDLMTGFLEKKNYDDNIDNIINPNTKGYLNHQENKIILYNNKVDEKIENNLLRKKLGLNQGEIDFNTTKSSKKKSFNIRELDLKNLSWTGLYDSDISKYQIFHDNSFFDEKKEIIYSFGGLGNFKFHNELKFYDLKNSLHQEMEIFGDKINPRYNSASYFDGKSIYIHGGVGNIDGDESLGRYYLNDLYKLVFLSEIELKENYSLFFDSINTSLLDYRILSKKIWSSTKTNFSSFSSENMVKTSLNDNIFYVMSFSKSSDISHVKLKKISDENSKFRYVGDSISFRTDKEANKVNLFHSNKRNKLYSVLIQYKDNMFKSNNLSIYSIDEKPIDFKEFLSIKQKTSITNTLYFVAIILIICVFTIAGKFSSNFSTDQDLQKDHIFVRHNRADIKIQLEDINSVEALKDYVKIITPNEKYIVHNNLSTFQKRLPTNIFIRIHRSTLINKNKVTKIDKDLVYINNHYYKIGDSYLNEVKKILIS